MNKIALFFGIMLAVTAASAQAAPGADKSAASADALTKTVSGRRGVLRERGARCTHRQDDRDCCQLAHGWPPFRSRPLVVISR